MINFEELNFKRIVMHQITSKDASMHNAVAIHDRNLFKIDDGVASIIKNRLSKAARSSSKAFDMEIAERGHGTFHHLVHDLKSQSNSVFIDRSCKAADMLAQAIKQNNIPGGYLLFIEATGRSEESYYIVIKAELQEVLKYEIIEQNSYIKALDDAFLSPSQKFFKIGIIYEHINLETGDLEERCFLFDSQFNIDSKPAEYFYKEFLGFTAEKNSKIQSKKFYEATESFIKFNIPAIDEKKSLLDALKQEFLVNDEPVISPQEFSETYFGNTEVRDTYINEVAPYMPSIILKDDTLIRGQLKSKTIKFPNKVKISGPDRFFDINVKIMNKENIEELNFDDDNFTLLKILGRPFEGE